MSYTYQDLNIRLSANKIRDAYAILVGVPDEQLFLNHYYSQHDSVGELPAVLHIGDYDSDSALKRNLLNCGTLACAAGWLVAHPTWTPRSLRQYRRYEDRAEALAEFHFDLFSARGFSYWDDEVLGYDDRLGTPGRLTDKELALYRLLRHLKYSRDEALKRLRHDTHTMARVGLTNNKGA